MCKFKSGIILKSKIVIAPEDDDSHSALLESLGMEDNYIGAAKVFIRAELIPENDEWWISPEENPGKWKFVVDQDIVPDWFDKEIHEKEFREAVCEWWKVHVLVDQKIEELNSGFYRLKRSEVKKLCGDVCVLFDNSTVGEMFDNSTVREMWGNSTVRKMFDNSTVRKMCDNSTVRKMFDNSTVRKMCDNSTVREMCDNSTVRKMCDNSTVREMWGNSTVREMCDNSTVRKMCDNSTVGELWGNSTVGEMCDNSTVRKMFDNSTVRKMFDNSTVRDFKHYPSIKILIPNIEKFELVAFKNPEEKADEGTETTTDN